MQNNEKKSILAIGAHAGDMEIALGHLLLKHQKNGFNTTLFHMTMGEKGSASIPPDEFRKIKEEQAYNCARMLNSEVIFGPYDDGEIQDSEEARYYICDIVREVKPTIVLTHWKNSIHKDHDKTHRIVLDGIFYAAMPSIKREAPAHQSKRLFFAENWEDKDAFKPYIYVDVSEFMDQWETSVKAYDQFSGKTSHFPYINYYKALTVIRGAETGFSNAAALDIDPFGKKIRMDLLG